MSAIDWLLELLYPTRCAFCHRLISVRGEKVCASCLKNIAYTQGAAQTQSFKNIRHCVSPLYYEGSVRDSLHRFKFERLTGYALVYAEILAKSIDENEITCDIITWVPVSRRRLRNRGYDQARLIAEELAKRLDKPCVRLLKKTRNNKAQSLTGSPEKRRANVLGAYIPVSPELAAGKHVLLVDDIVTTGATLSEAAGVLASSGALSIDAAAVARSKK